MRKLGTKFTKLLWLFHIIFMVMWLGGILSYLFVLLSINWSGMNTVLGAYTGIHAIDLYLIRNGAIGLVVTGLAYGIFTNWGFFKHKWIALKWIIALSQVIFGAFYLGSHLNENLKIVKAAINVSLENSDFGRNHYMLIIGCAIQTLILVATIVISKYKPWGKKTASKA